MRILIYRSRLLERSETFIADHYESLVASGVDCIFACEELIANSAEPYEIIANRTATGGKFTRMLAKAAFNVAPNSSQLARRISEFSPDIIHAHFAPDAAEILPIAKNQGIPLIVTLHGFDVTANPSYYVRKIHLKWPYLLRKSALQRYSSAFLPVSDYLRGVSISRGYPEKSTMTHYLGTHIPETNTQATGTRSGILFVGRLVEKKGCHHLINAFRLLAEAGSNAKLTIIGDGPQREMLHNLAKTLGDRVSFLGAQPRAEVLRHMRAASVFSMPSMPASSGDNEGFGMVYIEAQLSGAKIVAFDQGPVREALSPDNRAYLAEPGDVASLAVRLQDALARDSHNPLEAINYVSKHFNSKERAIALKAHYRSILSRPEPGQ